ncbi:MAG TPA: transporter substrate-binding domain-containing protein [Stellaceae bacterium]|nr:transporter substrate-binding domain-containing protein [Stellaceae bacterium]
MKAFTTGLAALAVGMAICIGGAASARSFDDILSSKKLVVGVNPTLPPLAKFNDQNQIEGFDVDVAKKFADMLGVSLEVVQVGSPDRVPFVASGKVDIVMGGLTRTPDRAKVIDFTVPLHTEALGVLTTEAKPFKSWKELNNPDVKLVEVRGTTSVDFIKKNLPKAQIILLDNYPDVIRALAQGRGDAVVDVIDYLGMFMKAETVKWKILNDVNAGVDYDGIGVARGNEALLRWLNVALFQLQSDGVIDDIYKKWFGLEMVYPIKPSPYF